MPMYSRTIVFTLVLAFALSPAFGASQSDRLDRKIQIMEKVLDEVLVQSEHVSVMSRSATRGLYLEGYGALFMFDGGLGESLMLERGRLRSGVFVVGDQPPKKGDENTSSRDRRFSDEHLELDKLEDLEKWKEESNAKKRENLAGLQNELIDTMLDYGTTLTELENGSWLTFVAFLGDNISLLGGGEEQRLQLQIKMSDIRQLMSGSLSRDEARKRVVISNR